MTNSLEERLKTHSTAFDGLLSLIPAKYYYDDATQDQWQQKKKSKKEAAEDKRAKLDPENASSADSYNNGGASAKDVMDNNAKNAKKVNLPKPVAPPSDHSDEEPLNGTTELVFDDEGDENDAKQEEKLKSQKLQQKSKPQKKQLSEEEKQQKEKRRLELKEKLASKIQTLREKRRAPGTKGAAPLKSREQILAERKNKQELKRQEKLKRKREEDEAEFVEGGNGDEDKSEGEDKSDDENDDMLFGNIVFEDGSRVTSDLSKLRNGIAQKKKKGPANNDIKAHLVKLENKKRKLASMTPEEQASLKESDQWKNLMSQAEGVKVKDDEKLLRKALKRKEKQKLRSETEWKERKQNVKDTIAARAKKREANLKARKDNKGKKGKNQPRLKKFSGVLKKGGKPKDGKKRPGFEGSAKSKGKK
ncbi:hypothetical protein CXQ85_000648 [Candidozyma haemuli]|uniref:Ribosomal RNA-processing protein 14/surfeit locus protein 6 C-terminal domain-containing protein n=1 Tax=Candidozyma haemuli TaxID=45357 RepID=A0A2V1AV64_9ASCO|nr:hypothetical protein CXQ85_000648 [[Candida] haemuloni]PVH21664.1 hypothetical protein CXQ85_000648 [[Candida] haemuloni]